MWLVSELVTHISNSSPYLHNPGWYFWVSVAAEMCAVTCVGTRPCTLLPMVPCHPGAKPGLLGSLCLTTSPVGTAPTASASSLCFRVFIRHVFVS